MSCFLIKFSSCSYVLWICQYWNSFKRQDKHLHTRRQAVKMMWECIWLYSHAGHHVTDLAEITQHPVMTNRDPFKGQFIDWQLWTGQFYFISPLFTVNVWKIHLVLFLCMHEIWKETKTCLSKKQEHDKNCYGKTSFSQFSLCSLCLTQMFANTIEGASLYSLSHIR